MCCRNENFNILNSSSLQRIIVFQHSKKVRSGFTFTQSKKGTWNLSLLESEEQKIISIDRVNQLAITAAEISCHL